MDRISDIFDEISGLICLSKREELSCWEVIKHHDWEPGACTRCLLLLELDQHFATYRVKNAISLLMSQEGKSSLKRILEAVEQVAR